MSISITVPNEHGALSAAAKMFQTLAADKPHGSARVTDEEDNFPGQDEYNHVAEQNAKDMSYQVAESIPEASAVFAPESLDKIEDDAWQAVQQGVDVELDSEGLPWDERIHAGSRARLAKGGGWKKKRGLDPETVETVEEELRELMAVPHVPTKTAPQLVKEICEAVVCPPIPVMDIPAPIACKGGVTTFPALIQAITTQRIPAERLNEILNANGVKSLPLLAARPDLIPVISAGLGL